MPVIEALALTTLNWRRRRRRARYVLRGIPCHVTRHDVDRRETFSTDEDQQTYLRFLQENLTGAAVRVLGWCLMTNHLRLVLVPEREQSLSILMRRVHGGYA